MELKEYIIPLRKWWWLVLAATIVSTASSYVATRLQVPLYRTQATLMIGQTIEDPNPDNISIYTTQQLTQSYAELAQRQPLRRATMEALGLNWLPEYRVNIVPNTQLLEIIVRDTDPVRAQVVANTLAQGLVQLSPTSTQAEEQQRQQFISEQLDSLETKIDETEAEIQQLQAEVTEMISARQIADTQNQIATLQAKLNSLQGNYATLLSNTREGAVNTLTVVEEADVPANPINANELSTILLGAAIGFTLAVGAAYLMEYLDNTLKTPEAFMEVTGLPIIGYLQERPIEKEMQEGVIVAESPRSPLAEAFRTLRTNLEFAGVDEPIRSLLVTSPDPGDGKSSTAANLAVSIAQSGKSVMLLDADMRRPRVHRFLSLPNRFGLSDLFRNQMSITQAQQQLPEIPDLSAITSGSLPPNPAELLGTRRMDEILAQIGEIAEIVIVDSPPFVVSDAALLASKVDGVVLVMQPGSTTAEAAKAMLEQLKRAGARVVGVVLNRIPRKGGAYYGGYRYYYAPYYYAGQYHANGDGLSEAGAKGERGEAGGVLGRLRRAMAGSADE